MPPANWCPPNIQVTGDVCDFINDIQRKLLCTTEVLEKKESIFRETKIISKSEYQNTDSLFKHIF